MSNMPAFSRHEAAILLDGYLQSVSSGLPRSRFVAQVSNDLRKMAARTGIEMDERYRNINGISFQMSSMESAFAGRTIRKPASALFKEIVSLYREDRPSFDRLLAEAKDMITEGTPPARQEQPRIHELQTKANSQDASVSLESRLQMALKKESEKNASGTTVTFLRHQVCRGGKPTERDVERILHRVPWAVCKYKRYYYKEPPDVPVYGPIRTLDWGDDEDLTHTIQVHFSYFDEYEFDVDDWKQLYASLVTHLMEDYPHVFRSLSRRNFISPESIGLGSDPRVAGAQKVGKNLYLETKIDAGTMVRRFAAMLDLCQVDHENIVIQYRRRSTQPKIAAQPTPADVHSVANAMKDRENFINWMKVHMCLADGTSRSYASAISGCEQISKDAGIVPNAFFGTDVSHLRDTVRRLVQSREYLTANRKQNNRFRAALRKYLEYRGLSEAVDAAPVVEPEHPNEEIAASVCVIDSTLRERLNHLLFAHFSDGMKLNAIRLDQFRDLYEDKYAERLTEDDDELTIQLKAVGTFLDGMVFPLQDRQQSGLLHEMQEAILSALDGAGNCVYISKVLERWKTELAEQMSVYNENALRDLLRQEQFPGVIVTDDVLKLKSEPVAPSESVVRVMQECFHPVNYRHLQKTLWFLPMDIIKKTLVSTPELVWVDLETYFYAPNFPATPAELRQIRNAMKSELDSKGFLVAQDIARVIKARCPSVAINTQGYKDQAYREIMGFLLRDSFDFSGAVVSERGHPLEMWQVYRSFAKKHETLSLQELKEFSGEVGVPIYWGDILHEMVRINQETMIRKDRIRFDVSRTDAVLSELCPGAYLPIREMNLFLQFPAIAFPWNSFVLECYLKEYSKAFTLYQVSTSQDQVCGVIVRRNSAFQNYEQVICDLLARDQNWINANGALARLVERGCQSRRRYSGFDAVMQKVAALRKEIEMK